MGSNPATPTSLILKASALKAEAFCLQVCYYEGMWQETKHGLYRQFNFANFNEAFTFMTQVAALAHEYHHYPRWENEWSVVQIWLVSMNHNGERQIREVDSQLSQAIDGLINTQIATQKAQTVPPPEKVKVFADGGSRGNPGPSASGYVVLDVEDKVLVEAGVYLGITTNNQAEYTALKLALEACRKLGAGEVQVYMDSMLVVNQMKGIFKIRNRELWPIHEAIKQLVQQFKHVSFQHVPREFNKLADTQVNKALDIELGITHLNS